MRHSLNLGRLPCCLTFLLAVSAWVSPAAAEQWIESWKPQPARWFIASKVDVGFAFARPRFSVGYGQPHQHWFGLDINPLISSSNGGGYTGLRFEGEHFEIRSGALYLQSFNRSLLVPRESYDRRDIDTRVGGNAEYVAWDSELSFALPLGPLTLSGEAQTFFLLNVPKDRFVFVAPLAVVMAPDFAFRQKLSLSFPMTAPEGLVLGPAIEPVWVPGRGEDAWFFRAGVMARWKLYEDVQIQTDLLPVVASPDALGREGAHFLEIKLRWYWATH